MIRSSTAAALAAALAAVLAAPALPRAAGPGGLPVPARGFEVSAVAHVERARGLAAAPNGDLLVGTAGSDVYLVPAAEAAPGTPRIFAHFDDDEAAGVTLARDTLFVGTEHGVWRLPYRPGDRTTSSAARRIAAVRSGGGDDHVTTTVAVAGNRLYASVGSSCNACSESDPTRATVQQMNLGGGGMRAKAIRIRNAIALATNPATGSVWAGVAGQDELEAGHPYEIFDPVSLHAGTPNYGWPACVENRRPARPGANCSAMTVARVALPAYATPTGAAFYPAAQGGHYAFPAPYRGGAFVTLHGSWHTPPVAPRVVFVPMRGDDPLRPVDWSDPGKQWLPFLGGFQIAGYGRIGRPSGVAVGAQGSLFVADDLTGTVYRIRPLRSAARAALIAGRAKT